MDLGYIQGYLPLTNVSLAENPTRSGLVMTFTEGSYGCPSGSRPAFPRSTTITFLCNPLAGKGFPVAVEPVEEPHCRYNFMWSSLYACPLCTLDDYEVVLGPCVAGYQSKNYVPKSYPNRCQGGLVPPPERVECEVNTIDCPAGTYINSEDQCVPARKGRYSIGGGVVVDRFDSLPEYFDDSGGWQMLGSLARSGDGDTSLTAKVFLVKNGAVSFEYKVVTFDESVKGFQFAIDDDTQLVAAMTTHYSYDSVAFELSTGEHLLSWRFIGGSPTTPTSRGNYVYIRKIIIAGTDYATRSDIPCPSGYYQSEEGQIQCLPCPQNTRSLGGAANCSPCNLSSYSLPASSECEIRHSCTYSDFTIKYGECISDRRLKYYVPLEPQICILNKFPFTTNESTEVCLLCPVGFFSQNGECVSCSNGKYWDYTSGNCISIPPGYYGTPSKTYFDAGPQIIPLKGKSNTLARSSSLPADFETYCYGTCGTDGWRMSNTSVESGFHDSAEVDSILTLVTTIVSKGSISFQYVLYNDIEDSLLDGLQFFINNQLQSERKVPYHPQPGVTQTVFFDLDLVNGEPTLYTFKWVYHQPLGSRGHDRIVMSNLGIVGDQSGGIANIQPCTRGTYSKGDATACSLCPVGTEGRRAGLTECTPCKDGFYADVSGMAECEACGEGTSSFSNRTGCDVSSCVFSAGDLQFNLSTLASVMSVSTPNSSYVLSLCRKLERESMCFAKAKLVNTFICHLDMETGVGRGIGALANVRLDESDVDKKLRLQYTKGSICGGGEQAQTNIRFICDPKITEPSEGLTLISDSECNTQFEWRNLAGCAICQDSDYTEQASVCKDGKQIIAHVKSTNCSGPDVWKQHSKDCHPTYPVTLPIAFLSLLVFIILVVGIVFISMRNKMLHDRYELLVNENATRASVNGDEGILLIFFSFSFIFEFFFFFFF